MLLTQLPSYFKARRDRLVQAHPGAAFIFPANPEFLRNPDVHYPFRQESHFFYLTGFEEASSCLVIAPSLSQPGQSRTILFVMARDPEKEIWDGERYGIEGARQVFGADEAYVIEEFESLLPDLFKGAEKLFYRLGIFSEMDRQVLLGLETYRRRMGRSGQSLLPIFDPYGPLGEMRLYKGPEEIDLLRKGCQITAQAHKTLMKEVKPGQNEAEVEALVDYEFRRGGCQRVGYGSIVAGGKNAACLHYRANNDVLRDGDLVLVDAGGEHFYYSADITRTFPVGRKFSPAQAKAYDLVLKSQKAGIAMAKPGATLQGIHKHVCEVMIEGLLSLGLLKGDPIKILNDREYLRFYPHQTSHWLGMDVHDTGRYMTEGSPRPLEPGMVLTVEPGFYVQPDDREVPQEYAHIGIRIEDDILITATGNENLTIGAPKERAEIEALRK